MGQIQANKNRDVCHLTQTHKLEILLTYFEFVSLFLFDLNDFFNSLLFYRLSIISQCPFILHASADIVASRVRVSSYGHWLKY